MQEEKKRNQIFNYLYVLAIIMVIDDHVSNRIGIFSSVFPYNSFYMPLFVFISGYFYKKSSVLDNLKHKTMKLFVPYLIWNAVALVLTVFIDNIFGLRWLEKFSVGHFIVINLITGSATPLNGAAWFVLMLFWVSIIYNFIHCKIKDNNKYDIIFTLFYIILGFVSLEFCLQDIAAISEWHKYILKTSFYIQFYHFGVMFKKYGEQLLHKYNKLVVCSLCITINVILICIFGDKISFYCTSEMNGFTNWYLPLITSTTGIIFYYEVMESLASKFGERKLISFIARNTFTIMEIHLLFVNIPNFFVYLMNKGGSTSFNNFPMEEFINSAWVRYSSASRLIGFFCGLLGSLLVSYIIEKANLKIAKKIEKG